MEVTNIKLELLGKNLVDLDYQNPYNYLGITKTNDVISPYSTFEVESEIKYPFIRIVNDGLFLLINSRTQKDQPNGLLFDHDGNLRNRLYLGDGIADVLVIKDKIIVSYFGEGVLGTKGPNNDGLAIFNLKGEYLFGYNTKHGRIKILDCYCMCKYGTDKILFSAYTEFNLIQLDIHTYKESSYALLENLRGTNAITTHKKNIYFHSPYHDEQGIYEWELGQKEALKIGEYEGRLRGLEYGQFLEVRAKSYNLITMNRWQYF